MFRRFQSALVALAGLAVLSGTAVAAEDKAQPDLIGVGGGYFDVQDNQPRDQAADFRLEYRFGSALLEAGDWFAVRPWLGTEVTSDGGIYGAGGLVVDIPIGPLNFSPSFGAGLHYDGNGKQLGSAVEFRSQAELSYRFQNDSRLSIAYGHISNAGLTEQNPGAEILTVYWHFPATWLFGR